MQNLLIFIDWYSPGFNAGGPVRSMINLVDYLHEDYNIKIITRNTDYLSEEPYKDIKPGEWTTIHQNVSCCYLSKELVNYKNLKKIIKQHHDHIIYINGIYSFYFSIVPLYLANKYAKKTIVAPRGMLAPSAINIKKSRKKFFINISRIVGVYRKVVFHATNENEANQIRTYISSKARIKIAANLPRKTNSSKPAGYRKQKGSLKMISIARIAPEKNTLYAIKLLNGVYKGTIEFDIYGSVYNENYYTQCKEMAGNLPENIHVNFKGPVHPELTEELYAGSHFLFMPTRGENFGHAILESFTAGTPVIISDQTPWKNLHDKKLGWDISLNKPETFQKIIQQCLDMDKPEHDKLRENTWLYAKLYCENEQLIKHTLKIFDFNNI